MLYFGKGVDYSYMESDGRLQLLLAIILLIVAMFCAITETAFSASSKTKIRMMAETGNKKAIKALSILNNFDNAISTILICTNIVHIAIATLVTVAVTKEFGVSFVSISTIITTIVVFFAGEMLPKSIAKNYAESLALFCATPLRVAMFIFKPLAGLLSAIGTGVSNLIKGEPELSVTEDELFDIIEDMTEDGTLDEEQGELISSALQFGDLTVESILTPRVDIIGVDISNSIESILAVIKSCTHSRLPVYEGSVDRVVGVLQIRKFIKSYLKEGNLLNLESLLDKPFFVHQSTKIDEALEMMSKNKQNIAIVTDNYGGTLGLVTIEDMLEELVGEIWDEEDVIEEPVVKVSDVEISVDADEHVLDAFDELDFEDPENNEELETKSLGAWAFENLGKIPVVGETFEYHSIRVSVSEMDNNRITRLKICLIPSNEEGEAN